MRYFTFGNRQLSVDLSRLHSQFVAHGELFLPRIILAGILADECMAAGVTLGKVYEWLQSFHQIISRDIDATLLAFLSEKVNEHVALVLADSNTSG